MTCVCNLFFYLIINIKDLHISSLIDTSVWHQQTEEIDWEQHNVLVIESIMFHQTTGDIWDFVSVFGKGEF